MSKKKICISVISLIVFLAIGLVFFVKVLLGDLSVFLPYSSKLIGSDAEKRYLILFQNNNELRPEGGFISAFGVLKIANGKFSLDFADSYSILSNTANLPAAPDPFYVFFGESDYKGWYFHDANFDPDFSDAAKDIEALYWKQLGHKDFSFDGIVGVNFEFLEDLVDIYDLKIGDVELSRENLFSVLEYQVKNIDTHDVEELKNRKNVLGELAKGLISEMKSSFFKYGDLLAAVNRGLDQKKIILFFKDKSLQRAVENEGWAGRFVPEDYGNFIYTSIANLGGRKSDRYVKKSHEYFVSFDEGNRGKVRYTLTLEHFGGYTLNSDVYNAYIRVFLPEGSDFKMAEGDFYNNSYRFIYNDGYFEGYVKLKPGETKRIAIEYLLPEEIDQSNFDLDIIKQPGTHDFWEVAFRLSADNSFEADGFELRDNVGFWGGYLLKDRHFDFNYIKDTLPPLVVWQRFLEPNLVEINFSEPLDAGSFLNPRNYEIVDMNYANDETETINVEKVYFEKGNVYLVTSGSLPVNGERYRLILKNLEDKSGNKTIPSVLELTLVKRF